MNAQLKNWKVIGGVFRGRLEEDRTAEFLSNIVVILVAILVLQIRESPLKDVRQILLDEEMEELEEVATEFLEGREYYDGLPLGNSDRDIVFGAKVNLPFTLDKMCWFGGGVYGGLQPYTKFQGPMIMLQ